MGKSYVFHCDDAMPDGGHTYISSIGDFDVGDNYDKALEIDQVINMQLAFRTAEVPSTYTTCTLSLQLAHP